MIIQGNIFVTTNIQELMQLSTQYKVIFIGDVDENTVSMVNGLRGSILIPPYNALQYKLDMNDETNFIRYYSEYLNEKEPTMFIAAMITAMIKGTNILLYLNQDEYNLYFKELWNYMQVTYGIIIGCETLQPQFNESFSWVICCVLYQCGFITAMEFLEAFPAGIVIPDSIIPRLSKEYDPCNSLLIDISFNGYKAYFQSIVDSKAKYGGLLSCPIKGVD